MSPLDIVPFVLIAGVIYFLIIKPQTDERNAHEALIASLAKDDKVVTTGGIHGRVIAVDTATITLEIGDKARIKLDKNMVARRADQPVPEK